MQEQKEQDSEPKEVNPNPRLTEKQYKESIYAKADKVKTKEELNQLVDEITTYGHDYGSIIYGCMAAMKAGFNVVNASPMGGITGFQAGCLGWECVSEFMSVQGPAKLLKYDDLLYPQYGLNFEKKISIETWQYLQEKATEELKKNPDAHPYLTLEKHRGRYGSPRLFRGV